MRALAAALLAALVVLSAGSPHVHTGARADHACPACLARTGQAAHSETPDVAPIRAPLPATPSAPVEAPPTGAPLGAIPGQSPPSAA